MIRHVIHLEFVGGRQASIHFATRVSRDALDQCCRTLEISDEIRSAWVEYQSPDAIRAHDADLAHRFKL